MSGCVQVRSWPQAPAPAAGCGEWRGMGAESSSLQRGAVVLEVMAGSVCPPAECSKWVSGQLALGSLGDLGVGSPCPRPPPPSLGLLET